MFTCKGCTEVTVLVREVSGLKQMMEDLKETVAELQLDATGAETGSRVTTTGVSQDREETAGNRTTIGCHWSRNRKQSDDDRSEPG